MSEQQEQTKIMSRGDAVALGAFMVAGAAIAVWMIVTAAVRIAELLSGGPTRVLARFAHTEAVAPIGPEGADLAVELDAALLIVPELPLGAVVTLVLEQVVSVVAVVTVVTCLLLVTASILRGRLFSRRNTRLVGTAGMVGLLGFAIVPFFANMGANEAFARLSEGTFDSLLITVDLFPLILIAFLAALAGLTFAVGDRLQRDTEGLV